MAKSHSKNIIKKQCTFKNEEFNMKSLVLLPVVLLVVLCCEKQSPVSVDGTQKHGLALAVNQWNSLDQSGKDLTIFSVALASIGKLSPNCKDAARTIVLTASGGVVNLPPTNKDDKSWAPSSNIVNKNISNISNVSPLDIIQMFYYAPTSPKVWEPHTAIVVSKNATTMTWIDGNFVSPGTIVGKHDVTFAQFNSYINPSGVTPPKPSGFTVYHVK